MIRIEHEYGIIQEVFNMLKNSDVDRLQRRLVQQLKFASTLSQKKNGAYDDLLEKVVHIVIAQVNEFGGVNKSLLNEVEILLSPLAEEAKSYEFLCVAHAHIDMNWMWGYDETVGATVDTFRTMLQLLKEYPGYHFSQSQASVYKILEEHDEDMLEEIKGYVKEGRWELTASTWVETDKNIPRGESFSRHTLYTKKYMKELFDINPDDLVIDFEPDTFGHNKNVPEILNHGGVKYYYHCRGHVGEQVLQRWVAPSGSDVIVYTEPFWYNATIDTEIANYATALEELTRSKTLLKVYGVGNHGGGPTRRDLDLLIEMNSWPIYPKFTFSTLKKYFDSIEPLKMEMPVLTDEINFLCDGCYTTQSTIKEGNRKSEQLLQEAETLAAMANIVNQSKYPHDKFELAWQRTLFNQFHDIIPGSGVTETREHASGLYQQVFATAEAATKSAMKKICDQIDTNSLYQLEPFMEDSLAEGGGPGFTQCGHNYGRERAYHIFNTGHQKRRKITEILVWDYEGDYGKLRILDSKGEELEFQIINGGDYWGHQYKRILVDVEISACGYETIILRDDVKKETVRSFHNDMRKQTPETFIIENDKLRVRFDEKNASILSIIQKSNNKELVDSSRMSGIFKLATEAVKKEVTGWNGGMSSWFTGRYKHIDLINDYIEMVPLEQGPLRQSIQYETKFRNSSLKVIVSLDKYSSALQYDVVCDFREFGSNENGVPSLFFEIPLPYTCNEFEYDIPFGVTNRAEANIEYPASSYAYAPNKKGELSYLLWAKAKHAFRCVDNCMSLTLIRGAYDPDLTPEIKTHKIRFALDLLPNTMKPINRIEESYDLTHEFKVVTGTKHTGSLPLSFSLYKVEAGTVMVSAHKISQDNKGLIIRFYECNGEDTEVKLSYHNDCKGAHFVDVTEKHCLEDEVKVIGKNISFKLSANKIATLYIAL